MFPLSLTNGPPCTVSLKISHTLQPSLALPHQLCTAGKALSVVRKAFSSAESQVLSVDTPDRPPLQVRRCSFMIWRHCKQSQPNQDPLVQ